MGVLLDMILIEFNPLLCQIKISVYVQISIQTQISLKTSVAVNIVQKTASTIIMLYEKQSSKS